MPRNAFPQVFISYSRHDREFATQLANALTRDGVSVWFDDWHLHVGDSILRKIQQGIAASDFMVIVLSKNSVESKWVSEELNAATMRNIESEGVFVLPALVERCQVPPFLADKKLADFTADYAVAYLALIEAIDHHFHSQGRTRTTLLETPLSVVHVSQTEDDGFPILTVTVANRSGRSQIVNRLECDIVEYYPYAAGPDTRVLKPLASWDIRLPYGEGTISFVPENAILIANDDAAAVRLRFHYWYQDQAVRPKTCAGSTVRVRLMTDRHLVAATALIRL